MPTRHQPGFHAESRVIDRGGRQVGPGEAGGSSGYSRSDNVAAGSRSSRAARSSGGSSRVRACGNARRACCVRRPCRRGLLRRPPRWRRPASTVAGGVARRRGSPTRVSVGRIRRRSGRTPRPVRPGLSAPRGFPRWSATGSTSAQRPPGRRAAHPRKTSCTTRRQCSFCASLEKRSASSGGDTAPLATSCSLVWANPSHARIARSCLTWVSEISNSGTRRSSPPCTRNHMIWVWA